MRELEAWESFYLIVGGAAGALIGLQFVVMTLIAGRPQPPQAAAGHAFATPTIVHFSVVLWLCAMIRVPWEAFAPFAFLTVATGLAGVGYSMIVVRRIRRQTMYKPEATDLVFYAGAPLVGYVLLIAVPALVRVGASLALALTAFAAASLLLLFLGIHNAWDTVTYHVFDEPGGNAAAAPEIAASMDSEA